MIRADYQSEIKLVGQAWEVRSTRGPTLPTVILRVPADEYKHAEEKYVLRMMKQNMKDRTTDLRVRPNQAPWMWAGKSVDWPLEVSVPNVKILESRAGTAVVSGWTVDDDKGMF